MPRKEYDRLIVWLRRDLRLEDNVALTEACAAADSVIPLFVVDNDILSRPDTGPARVSFLLDALQVLDKNLRTLGGRLIIRHGKVPDEVVAAAYDYNAQGVYFQDEYEPYGRVRDENAVRALRAAGKTVRSFPGLALAEPAAIISQAGTPYTVFTPYKRVWFETQHSMPLEKPKVVKVPQEVQSLQIPKVADLNIVVNQRFDSGGEDQALLLLSQFKSSRLETYSENRNFLPTAGTSKLSSHLHLGTISARKIVYELKGCPGDESFLSEIAWRDFYLQILYHFPYVEKGPFKRQFEGLKWSNEPSMFRAWCEGQTGFPIVDAAMRQLKCEAWMHNRARMIVASFLTKDLLINWQQGEEFFMKNLVDGDLASNNGGWQWSAGTGTDAQPYFRIFNPVSQGEKFDPDGDYVRRYVPELRRLPTKVIHSPWVLTKLEQEAVGCVLGRDYPHPIVDHAIQRKRAIELYRSSATGE